MATLQELKQAKNAAILFYQDNPTDENLAARDKAIADYEAAEKAGESKDKAPAEQPKTPGADAIAGAAGGTSGSQAAPTQPASKMPGVGVIEKSPDVPEWKRLGFKDEASYNRMQEAKGKSGK